MAGVAVDLDNRIRAQVIRILEEYGLVPEHEMTYEEAEEKFYEHMEKSKESARINGWLSHKDVWDELDKKYGF